MTNTTSSNTTTPPQITPPTSQPEGFNQFLKGFVAGAFLASMNKRLLLGAVVGVLTGAYYQQDFGAPNVKQNLDKVKKMVLDSIDSANKK